MSDKEKNTEQLRAILQQKMAEASAVESGWNVPSDDVWMGLETELQANREKPSGGNSGMLYLMSAISIALLTVLLLRECSHSQQLELLRNEKQGIESSYQELKENCSQNAVIDSVTKQNENKVNKSPKPNLESTPVPIFQNDEAPKRLRSNEIPNSEIIVPQDESTENISNEKGKVGLLFPSIPSMNFGGNIFSENMLLELIEVSKRSSSLNSFDEIQTLPISAFPLGKQNLELDLPKENNQNKGLVLVPSLHAAFSLTSNRLTGEIPDIISNQKALSAYRGGIGLEAVLSRRLSIETGLQYATYRIQTDYALEVAFTHENEYTHDDGGIDNQYNHSLPSSMGDYPAQFVLTRADDAIIHEGEIMNLDLSVIQQSQFLSLPLYLRYSLGNSRLRTGIKAGVVANRLMEVNSETPELISNHSEIHQRHTSIGNPLSDNLERNTLDVSFGIDLRYHVTPRLGISLEGNYQRGITPVYQTEALKNYLDAGNVGVGLHFFF